MKNANEKAEAASPQTAQRLEPASALSGEEALDWDKEQLPVVWCARHYERLTANSHISLNEERQSIAT